VVKQTKSQRLREKARLDIKYSKQSTLDSPAEPKQEAAAEPVMAEQKKQIEITDLTTSTREDELVLTVGFKLLPSRTAFSRVGADLFFDEEKIDSLRLRILQGPLASDSSEFSSVLDMTGLAAGKHNIRVDMFELWGSDERLGSSSKELSIDYVPVKREDRLMKVPVVKKVSGESLDIVTETQKHVYRELEEEMKRESEGKRDYW
jgi:hypothetical protein